MTEAGQNGKVQGAEVLARGSGDASLTVDSITVTVNDSTGKGIEAAGVEAADENTAVLNISDGISVSVNSSDDD